jgi:hypothetical protein
MKARKGEQLNAYLLFLCDDSCTPGHVGGRHGRARCVLPQLCSSLPMSGVRHVSGRGLRRQFRLRRHRDDRGRQKRYAHRGTCRELKDWRASLIMHHDVAAAARTRVRYFSGGDVLSTAARKWMNTDACNFSLMVGPNSPAMRLWSN